MQMQMQMQELQPINGVINGGGGGGGGGSGFLRRTNYADQPPHAPPQAALKCPRCDSLNTKFCYFNNYNLSQPRHFCKNCRRYWTKGGVLRNVPVGGGCRKAKRTSSSSTSSSSSSSKSKSSSSSNGKKNGSNSHSSSKSSAVDGVSCGGLFQIPEAENAVEGGLFSDDVGGFINLISSNNNEVNINNNDGNGSATASFSEIMQNQEWKIMCGVHEPEEKNTVAVGVDMGDPTVRIEDLLQNRGSNNVDLPTLDWHLTANINQSLFDVPDNSNVDHHDYWSQSSTAVHHHHHHHDPQWSDSTTTHFPLFLP